MRACVFVGPTVPPGDFPGGSDLEVLPPAAQGDVYRAAKGRPQAIGIIDGYFEGVLSVWHKEILWAMAEGIHVFGSASMGALRAAELHPFGMQGIGRIFEDYRDQLLEDDDEVAVLHGPQETGYVALSEAMVNMRATFAAAAAAGAIDPASRDALVGIAKGLFYHERNYRGVLERAAAQGVPAAQIEAFGTWLPAGRVDQKRADALAMVAAMRAFIAGDPEPMRAHYVFEWTEMWDDATASAAASRPIAADREGGWVARGAGARGAAARPRCLPQRPRARAPGPARPARGRPAPPSARPCRPPPGARPPARPARPVRARRPRALACGQRPRRGPARTPCSRTRRSWRRSTGWWGLPCALACSTSCACAATMGASRGAPKDKQDRLKARGLDHPRPEDAGVVAAQVLAWYFEQRLARPLPDDIDAAAREFGFEDRDEFYRALLREYLDCSGSRARGRAGPGTLSGVRAPLAGREWETAFR